MSLVRLDTPAEAQAWCAARRAEGRTLGFVATMGFLHEGHLTLVRRALAENDLCAVSVFVNPLQFGEAADLDNYPRDLERDAELLEGAGAQLLFTGTLAEFFPDELAADGSFPPEHLVDPGPGAVGMEGEFRGGHFDGVATIVDRLFDVTTPTRAYFGQKDLQQTLVVSHLAAARGGPEVVACAISREPSGLARSSRNARLSEAEREQATCLSRGLARASSLWQRGERDPARLEAALAAELRSAGIEPEYAAVRDLAAWSPEPPSAPLAKPVALVAARVGPVRLIDNHVLDEPAPGSEPAGA